MTAEPLRAPTASCDLCYRPARYQFGVLGGSARRCLRHALGYQPMVRRALRVALVVGTLLFAINQADIVLHGDLTLAVACKIGLTYLVPYSVSTYSALQINRV
jgi:hypothetical protein